MSEMGNHMKPSMPQSLHRPRRTRGKGRFINYKEDKSHAVDKRKFCRYSQGGKHAL